MKRLIVWILAAMLLLSGCSSVEPEPQEGSPLGAYGNTDEAETTLLPARSYISLVFYEDMDINPLTTAVNENHELLKLVYSPLLRLDERLTVHYVLAENVLTEEKTVTVYLRPNLKFSDGSAVTAGDVVSSLKTVRNTPTSPYYARLLNVKSVSEVDERTVRITLREKDVDFVNCLDIPVMKKGGNAGCGPYQFGEQGGERVLVPNPNYFLQPKIATIYLKKPAGEKDRQNMFSVGLLDVYFAAAESELVFTGGKSFRTQTYAGDNLLYLGMNCSYGILTNGQVRYYLNQLMERSKLVENVLLGQAEATAYPFQPAWYKATGLTQGAAWTEPGKKEKAAAYGLTLSENVLTDASGQQLTFTLMALQESDMHKAVAQAVADSYALSGVKILPELVDRVTYNTRLAAGEYQLYLGELKTGRTLNPTLFAAGSVNNFSKGSFPALEEAAAAYKRGEIKLTEFAAVYDEYTPLIPLAYRRGVLFSAADIGDFRSTGTWALYGDITELVTLETEISK